MAVDTSEKFVGDFFQVEVPSATEPLTRGVCSPSQQALVKLPPSSHMTLT